MVRVRHSIGNIVLANRRNRYLVGGQAAGLLLVYDGSLWVEHAPADSIPYPGERRVIQAQASGAAPFIEVLGAAASTATGTASANNSIDSVYTNFVQAAATINTFAGFASAVFNLVRRQHNPRFVCLLRTGPNAADIQNIRFWVGLSSATVAVTTDTLATSFIGFRWGTSTPDAGWVGVVSDGTNQSLTSALTGTVAVDTVYKLAFRVDDTAGAVHFSVNDGPELTLMTNLPASATELGYHCRQITLAAATKNFKVSRLYVEAN